MSTQDFFKFLNIDEVPELIDLSGSDTNGERVEIMPEKTLCLGILVRTMLDIQNKKLNKKERNSAINFLGSKKYKKCFSSALWCCEQISAEPEFLKQKLIEASKKELPIGKTVNRAFSALTRKV